MDLITVTVRTACRTRVGQGDFQEVGISLCFSARNDTDCTQEEIVGQAGDALEKAFHQLLMRLEEGPPP
jgi:hypothetical protein